MRLERRPDGEKGELSLGRGPTTMTHVLSAKQLARLAIWIEELFPEAMSEARKPAPPSNVRSDDLSE